MPIIDRYITTFFVKIFAICFLSLAGLYVVVDAFTNLEELLGLTKKGSVAGTITGYYGPRVLQFFDKTAAFLALVAAMFCMALMKRSNELTAIQAGGISDRRIVRPVLAITIAVLLLTIVNREVLIPHFRNELALNAQDLMGSRRRVMPATDPSTGMIIRGQEVSAGRQEILVPRFLTPADWGIPDNVVAAEQGVWLPATATRPAGYLLSKPDRNSAGLAQNILDASGETVIFVPAQSPWLESDQIFVRAAVDTVQLAFPVQLARNASLVGMVSLSRQPGTGLTNRLHVDIHSRIVQPFFDLTILLIGLPMILARGERNFYMSAGLCLVVVLIMSLVLIASQGLGASRIVTPPALAAWIPLLVFLPIGWTSWGGLGR